MRIGTLAALSGATPRAIRLYERLGLLDGVARHGSYRHYAASHLERIRLIRQAQQLGFRLAELGELLRPGADGAPDWQALLGHLQHKRREALEEIAALQRRAEALQRTADELRACLVNRDANRLADCRVPA